MSPYANPKTLSFVEEYCRRNFAIYGFSALYFFGSRAHGNPRSNSDHDFFAVVSDSAPYDINTWGALHTKLLDDLNRARGRAGLNYIDLLIARQTDFQDQSVQMGTYAHTAFTKGTKLA